MQKSMDQHLNDPCWEEDGAFSVRLSSQAGPTLASDNSDIIRYDDGNIVMMFSWLPQQDLYALCYFLSSVTLTAKNSQDGHKAEKYLQEGLRMLRSKKSINPYKLSYVYILTY